MRYKIQTYLVAFAVNFNNLPIGFTCNADVKTEVKEIPILVRIIIVLYVFDVFGLIAKKDLLLSIHCLLSAYWCILYMRIFHVKHDERKKEERDRNIV